MVELTGMQKFGRRNLHYPGYQQPETLPLPTCLAHQACMDDFGRNIRGHNAPPIANALLKFGKTPPS